MLWSDGVDSKVRWTRVVHNGSTCISVTLCHESHYIYIHMHVIVNVSEIMVILVVYLMCFMLYVSLPSHSLHCSYWMLFITHLLHFVNHGHLTDNQKWVLLLCVEGGLLELLFVFIYLSLYLTLVVLVLCSCNIGTRVCYDFALTLTLVLEKFYNYLRSFIEVFIIWFRCMFIIVKLCFWIVIGDTLNCRVMFYIYVLEFRVLQRSTNCFQAFKAVEPGSMMVVSKSIGIVE